MTKSRAKERCTVCTNSYNAGKNGTRICPYCSGEKPMPAPILKKPKRY